MVVVSCCIPIIYTSGSTISFRKHPLDTVGNCWSTHLFSDRLGIVLLAQQQAQLNKLHARPREKMDLVRFVGSGSHLRRWCRCFWHNDARNHPRAKCMFSWDLPLALPPSGFHCHLSSFVAVGHLLPIWLQVSVVRDPFHFWSPHLWSPFPKVREETKIIKIPSVGWTGQNFTVFDPYL